METSRRKTDDEIDLLYFFNPLFRGVGAIQRKSKTYVHVLRRNLGLFLLIFFLFAAAGYALRFVLPRYYKTSATLATYYLPSEFCAHLINSLNSLTNNRENMPVLARQLNIAERDASSIYSIGTTDVDSMYMALRNDSTPILRVELIVRNASSIPAIENALRVYLESNEFAKKRKLAKIRSLESIKNNLILKRAELDSLKEIVNQSLLPRSTGQGIVFGEPVSPVSIYTLQEDFFRQQLAIEERLGLLENIEVVQPFIIPGSTNYPDYKQLFLYTLIAGIILALVLTPLLGKRR